MTEVSASRTDIQLPDEDTLARAVLQAKSAASSVLGPRFRDSLDDVLQETWISAKNSLKHFDGSALQAWVNTIAKRRAMDVIEKAGRLRKHQDKFELESTSRYKSSLSLVADDFADLVSDQQAAAEELGDLLEHVEAFIQNQATCSRALALITTYGDRVDVAAQAMTISKDALRSCRREFVRCAVVVSRALDARSRGLKPTMDVLIDCLPGAGDSGEWLAAFVTDVVACGGFANADLGQLMERTGKSYNTVRQYREEALWLVRIAMTVLTQDNEQES
ncbi:RNA polymerase sigma factor [Glutamicibacter arilaitensis]|uniref:RNA polymerase sigma factor n=1 Tax=Glutamicibacter arilaitensis TaxID=256701 RepID=UPI003FD3E386